MMYAGACFHILSPTKRMSEFQISFFFCSATMPDKKNVKILKLFVLIVVFIIFARQKECQNL